MYLTSSTLSIVDVTMGDNSANGEDEDMYDSGATYTCVNRCSAGQFATCTAATGNMLDSNPCHVNCGTCTDCPAGTANDANGSTTFDACEECAPGYVSQAGALACTECEVRVVTRASTTQHTRPLRNANPAAAAAHQPLTTTRPPSLPRRAGSRQTRTTVSGLRRRPPTARRALRATNNRPPPRCTVRPATPGRAQAERRRAAQAATPGLPHL